MRLPKWIENGEPIFKTEGDGQSFQEVYSRQNKSGFQYAVVTRADDGTFQSMLQMNHGEAREVEIDE